jgi:hypothetical protein
MSESNAATRLNETLHIRTRREGLIRKDFRCANITRKMGIAMIVKYGRVSTDEQTLDAFKRRSLRTRLVMTA